MQTGNDLKEETGVPSNPMSLIAADARRLGIQLRDPKPQIPDRSKQLHFQRNATNFPDHS